MNAQIEQFENLLTKGNDSALLRFSLGNAYFNEENYQLATEHLQEAVKFDAKFTAAWKLLGKSLVKLEKHSEAIQAYKQGIHVAEEKGDMQALKEMQIFLKRLENN